MGYSRRFGMGIAMAVMIGSCCSSAFAQMAYDMDKGGKMDQEFGTDQTKVLRDAAMLLQPVNQGLSKGLIDLADRREKKMEDRKEMEADHEARMKLLKDSASALQASNPVVAQELQKMSEERPMMMQEAAQEKNLMMMKGAPGGNNPMMQKEAARE